MKKINLKKSILLLTCAAVLWSCGKKTNTQSNNPSEDTTVVSNTAPLSVSYAGFIPIDSANKMIGSYLSSIEAESSYDPLYSLLLDADELRVFLSDNDIHGVKVMLAHTLDYINNGNEGLPAGYKSGALTIVFAGYDVDGDYVYAPGDLVPNEANPCPPLCKANGTAVSNLLE